MFFLQTVTFAALFLTLRHLQVHSCTTSRMQPMSFAGAAKLMKSQVGWHLRDPPTPTQSRKPYRSLN